MRHPILRMVGEAAHVWASVSSFGQVEGGGRKENRCLTLPVRIRTFLSHPKDALVCRNSATCFLPGKRTDAKRV